MKEAKQKRSQPNVLVVDDDAIMRGVAHESLSEAGFAVSAAENGLLALEVLKNSQPDIILLDVMMPKMDGFDTSIAIRQLPGCELVPILIMTALEDLDSINRAYEVGATDFITKPINWVILVQRVRYMLRAVRTMNAQRRLQEELQQAQKLEAVATLAGGIAHDFNNLLQAIQGSSELLLLNKHEGAREYRQIKQIIAAVDRGAALTRQILTYSRKIESEKRPIDLNDHIRQAHQLLRRTIPKMVRIELQLEADLKMVNADAVQIEQVLMNLAINARDAMPDGGRLVITSANAEPPNKGAGNQSVPESQERVMLSVSDTGHGMNKDTVDQIFEPFFSTKAPGQGTGLGLSMVHGIVKNHNGQITCRSRPGKGTRFSIYLPAVAPKMKVEQNAKKTLSQRGNETILLVDDEDAIRHFGKLRLEKAGYTVIAVSRGERAVEVFQRDGQRIHLVLLDLIMPGMGGEKCLQQLLGTDPGIKVIITSGDALDERAMPIINACTSGYLRKPYSGERLLSAVRRALDSNRSTS